MAHIRINHDPYIDTRAGNYGLGFDLATWVPLEAADMALSYDTTEGGSVIIEGCEHIELSQLSDFGRGISLYADREKMGILWHRILRACEKQIWDALHGQVIYHPFGAEPGNHLVIDYGLLKPVAAIPWSDRANSDPLADIDSVVYTMEERSGEKATDLYITSTLLNSLLKSNKIIAAFNGTMPTIEDLESTTGLRWTINDHGWMTDPQRTHEDDPLVREHVSYLDRGTFIVISNPCPESDDVVTIAKLPVTLPFDKTYMQMPVESPWFGILYDPETKSWFEGVATSFVVALKFPERIIPFKAVP